MRSIPILLVSAAVVLTLTGCAAQATAKDVTPEADKISITDVLIGDSVPLAASVHLRKGSPTGELLEIQSSSDGKSWTTLAKTTAKRSTASVTANFVTKSAGKVDFRTAVFSPATGHKLLKASSAQSVSVSDIKELVRTLLYNHTHAYLESTTAGIAFDEANDYPKLYDFTSAAYQAEKSNWLAEGLNEGLVPELSTISPAPTWVPSATSCSAAATTPPAGESFIVTADVSDSYSIGYEPDTSKADMHVTYLDGRLYYYLGC